MGKSVLFALTRVRNRKFFQNNKEKRRDKKWIIARNWERKEKKSILMCMFGNRKRRGKEKRMMYFFFLCVDCNEKENEKKKYIYIFKLLCSYKCKRCIKVMSKCVTSCHIMLCMWALLLKNHSLPSNPPNLGGLQICGSKESGFFLFYLFLPW